MSDAYGRIIFSSHSEAVFQPDALCDALNEFKWAEDAQWEVIHHRGKLSLCMEDGSEIQYPTAAPVDVVALIVPSVNGAPKRVPVEEATEEDWDNFDDQELEPIEMRKLSEMLSPLVTSHWIEVACIYAEKLRYVGFESLRVYSDGKVEFRKHLTSSSFDGINILETYPMGKK